MTYLNITAALAVGFTLSASLVHASDHQEGLPEGAQESAADAPAPHHPLNEAAFPQAPHDDKAGDHGTGFSGSPSCEVVSFELAKDVVNREPQGVTQHFTTNDFRAYAHAKVKCPKPTHLSFLWKKNGALHLNFVTEVKPSPGWRTYSYVTVKHRPAAHWSVDLLDENNQVLKTLNFTTEESH